MLQVLRKYHDARDNNMLLAIPFLSISDYLHELRSIAQLMKPLGPNALLYLAAAVSDFFVPPDRMSEHKIQSTDAADLKKKLSSSTATSSAAPSANPSARATPASGGSVGSRNGSGGTGVVDEETFDNFDSSPTVPRSKRLVVDLDPVPKFLKNLVEGWSPEGMIVSFKLETDPSILTLKAKYSLNRYQHHLVIGNLLYVSLILFLFPALLLLPFLPLPFIPLFPLTPLLTSFLPTPSSLFLYQPTNQPGNPTAPPANGK